MKRYSIFFLVLILGCCRMSSVSAESTPANTAQSPAVARSISPPENATSPHTTDDANAAMKTRPVGTTIAALGAILLLFLGLVQIWRRYSPLASQSLPETAWEILGSAPLDQKYQLTIVRVGSRLIVLGKSDQGLQTLSEITNGEEVAQLMTMCQAPSPETENNAFGNLLNSFKNRTSQAPLSSTEETRHA